LGSGNLIQTDAPYEKSLRTAIGFKGTREWWVCVRDHAPLAKTLGKGFAQSSDNGRPAIGALDTAAITPAGVGVPPVQVDMLEVDIPNSDVELATTGSGVL